MFFEPKPKPSDCSAVGGATTETRAKNWVDARLERGRKQRFTEDVMVTPSIAAELLKLNKGNRPISRRRVAKHVLHLQRGEWLLTHQGIAVSKDGLLNDGQHRLTAIVEAGVNAPLPVTFGCERAEFAVVDVQGTRSFADVQMIEGHANSALRAAIIRKLCIILTTELSPDSQQCRAFGETLNQNLLDSAAHLGQGLARVVAPSVPGTSFYLIAANTKYGTAKVEEFFEMLRTGASCPSKCPILRLRDLFMAKHMFGCRAASDAAMKGTAHTILTWNAWVNKCRPVTDWPHLTIMPGIS